jgi:hypothetical protein
MKLAQENIPADEPQYTDKIIDSLRTLLEKQYKGKGTMRAFHPKIIGLVKAEFIVEENLPENLKRGLFKEGKTFQAWVRLSNAKRKPQADAKKDLRGMAIKLLGVPGEKMLASEKDAQTHDFLLITHETLQTDTVKSFQKGIAALLGGPITMLLFALNPFNWGTIRRSLQSLKKFGNILEAPFWSTTPYLLGDGQAVKYAVRPQRTSKTPQPENPSPDFLRDRLAQDLQAGDAYFDFCVQVQTNADTMPIEDPTKPWEAPLQKVATIRILKQTFNTPEQLAYGQSLAFTPWHCLPEHRPLGGANRARKKAYEVLSAFRLQHNNQQPVEPTDWSIQK